ncbi:protein GrpE [Spirochaetia bacterium]|nr:protein GrpE [Spirochaetia bacterium]
MSKHTSHDKYQEGAATNPAAGGTEQPDLQSAREAGSGEGAGPAPDADSAGEGRGTASETAAGDGATGMDCGANGRDGAGLAKKIADLEAQLADSKDQFLRKAADFENFRKRMNQEKQNAIDFANQSLLLDLIPIIDDFDRAIQSAKTAIDAGNSAGTPPSNEFNALYEGIGMISKRLSSQLDSKWGLKSFDSAGEPFDPNRHEALMMEKSAEIIEPVVQQEFLKGYTLKDRIVRSAKVKVLMPETPAAGAESGAASENNGA